MWHYDGIQIGWETLMRGPHDIGGLAAGAIDTAAHDPDAWEKTIDATFVTLAAKGYTRADEMRRMIEQMGEPAHLHLGYYERWTAAMMRIVIEKGILTQDEIDARVRSLASRQPDPKGQP